MLVRPGYREKLVDCKAHLRYMCNFITEFQGHTNPAMEIYMHIFYACTFHLFAHANLCYPTTRLCSYFSTIFVAHLCVYTRRMGCKRGFSCTCNFITAYQGHTDPAMFCDIQEVTLLLKPLLHPIVSVKVHIGNYIYTRKLVNCNCSNSLA